VGWEEGILFFKNGPLLKEAISAPTHPASASIARGVANCSPARILACDLEWAVHYGLGPSSLLFALNVDNSMQMGADVQWISVFPAEAEVVFPPLTYLQPTGRVQSIQFGSNCFQVVEVSPHIS